MARVRKPGNRYASRSVFAVSIGPLYRCHVGVSTFKERLNNYYSDLSLFSCTTKSEEPSLIASRIVGAKGKIFAFEPDPISFSFLKKNLILNNCTNVIPFAKAVSNRQGKFEFYTHSVDSSKNSLVQRKGAEKKILVDCVTLDNFLDHQQIDVIKIDVEGAEMQVLEGMKNIMLRNPQLVLFIEFNPAALAEANSDQYKFMRFLAELNYSQIISLDETRNAKGDIVLCNLYCQH